MATGVNPELEAAEISPSPSRKQRRTSPALKWLLLILPIAYLWFRLIDNLRLEWSTNPQYSYGWVVPVLCIGLAIRRWFGSATSPDENTIGKSGPVFFLFLILALLYLPTRLIEEATPEWRPLQWAFAFETVGLTLCVAYLFRGRECCKKLMFPLCFFLVAVPWPTLIETPLIQALARLNASAVVEILGASGVPAIQHGNVIEVGTGTVGIDDACSGIRSFQSSLMIALFLGEFFMLTRMRRLVLVPIGFLFALGLNVCRTTILTWIAAKQGTAAIVQYHDQAGLTILVICTVGMWGIGWLFKHFQSTATKSKAVLISHAPLDRLGLATSSGGVLIPALSLLVWLGMVESVVQLWYHNLESRLAPIPNWSVSFPTDNPTFKDLPITATTRSLLRFDDGKQGEWGETGGIRWQGFYFNWLPGRVAGYLAKRHTPEICLPAAGRILRSGPTLGMLNVHGVDLPMRQYVFESGNRLIHVFQCRWEAGAGKNAYIAQESARYNLIRAVWAGRGKHGQKVLELIVSGIDEPSAAKNALVTELEKVIKVNESSVAQIQ